MIAAATFAMHHYGITEVEKLLRLPRSTIRSLVAAGFVTPARGPRNALSFSFQDLIVLRTAQALATARIPHRRILRALKELRGRLPEEMPLSGLSIGAFADHVVVREGARRWQAETGQYVLAFEGDPEAGQLRVIEQPLPPVTTIDPADWHAEAAELERSDPDAAIRAYERAIAADAHRHDASINLGRLLHELGRQAEAEQVYRTAIATGGGHDPLLHYNLAIVLEDLDRKDEAVRAYEAALQQDPHLADAHYNLGLLHEALGQPMRAIRHMAQYRRLTK